MVAVQIIIIFSNRYNIFLLPISGGVGGMESYALIQENKQEQHCKNGCEYLQ